MGGGSVVFRSLDIPSALQNRPGNGGDLAINAELFTVYFGCAIHFWYMYRRAPRRIHY